MAVNLVKPQKGQKVNLTKMDPTLAKVLFGAGWDVNYTGSYNFDVDISALMIAKNDVYYDHVQFSKLSEKSGSVKHMGDNLTGAGEGDDEQVIVTLPKVPEEVERVSFFANIYNAQERRQDFSMILNFFFHVMNLETRDNLVHFDISGKNGNPEYKDVTGMFVGEVYRHQGEWKFNPEGNPCKKIRCISDMIRIKCPSYQTSGSTSGGGILCHLFG